MSRIALRTLEAQYVSGIGAIVMSGISKEWSECNLVQDLVAKKILKAFRQRKVSGMGLSDRVWNLSQQYKSELEEAITAAIAQGISAIEMAS